MSCDHDLKPAANRDAYVCGKCDYSVDGSVLDKIRVQLKAGGKVDASAYVKWCTAYVVLADLRGEVPDGLSSAEVEGVRTTTLYKELWARVVPEQEYLPHVPIVLVEKNQDVEVPRGVNVVRYSGPVPTVIR